MSEALPPAFDETLSTGLAALGVSIDSEAQARLRTFAGRLLHWNRRVNLTAITAPVAVAELHLVDSLSLLRTLGDARSVLDIGSGAGLPGVVLACARPMLRVTCCDSVHKKVAFVKAVAAELNLEVEARAVRAAGDPAEEGLPLADAVVSRAFADPNRWLGLAVHYLCDHARVFAMLGRQADGVELRAVAESHGLELEVLDEFTLPSGAVRAVARFRRR